MTVWSLGLTMSKYLSQHSTRATIYSCTVDWQYRREECSVTQPCQCETERNWSLTHFLCCFLMGLLSGWLEGGTARRGEKREVDVVNKLKEGMSIAIKLFHTWHSFGAKTGLSDILEFQKTH